VGTVPNRTRVQRTETAGLTVNAIDRMLIFTRRSAMYRSAVLGNGVPGLSGMIVISFFVLHDAVVDGDCTQLAARDEPMKPWTLTRGLR